MANRHLARSVVLQSLFEIDSENELKEKPEDVLMRNISEFASEQSIFPFMKQLFDLVQSKEEDLNKIIEEAAPEWPLEKIAVVDRNILRIGLAELLFSDPEQVPPKVAINEAIELAKEFGGESSSKFVNGVLGAVYKEVSGDAIEPAKEGKKKEPKKVIIEELVGAVVYSRDDAGQMYVALVHDVFGHWTLPKGQINSGEESKAAVVRKVKDEIGLQVEVEDELGENEYGVGAKEEGKKKRHAVYYLASAPFEDLQLKKEGGLDDAQWFKMVDIVDLNFYDDVLPIITKAVNILASK